MIQKETVDLPLDKWTNVHRKDANGNSKAMNAIFSAVDANVFKLISNCEIAKDEWDILTIVNQGTKKVREEHICQLTTLLENITMKDEEIIA